MAVIVSRMMEAVTDAVYPPQCAVCGGLNMGKGADPADSIHAFPAAFLHPFVCTYCDGAFTPVQSPMCTVCGRMFETEDAEDHVCGDCIQNPRRFSVARAGGIYADTLMVLIHQFKYNGKTGLARPLGELLFSVFLNWYDPGDVDVIVPVPLHHHKFRQRGFNQSYLLLREWGRSVTAADARPAGEKICRDAMVRRRKTRSQTTLSKKERRTNVKGAFGLKQPERIKGKRVVLVDDVYTTGATVNECAKTLLAGGAARVDVLTLARVG
ncbi:MAG: ComF family protein [Thermodesulfobacteriota bacterium]|nr:ComF family protein [Thermodesulfobacteriota bacterium]